MKAIIPLAGKGTRLRPHTYLTPKPLVKVGGRPVMSYVLDDIVALGVTEVVFIVGYLGDEIEGWVRREYPMIQGHYVVQEVQDGTAGAVALAEPWANDELLIVFVDTIFDADLGLARALDSEWAGVIWAKEVEDYHRFGVIVTDESGAMTRIVEKPTEPISKLANIGLYFIRDYALLFEGIRATLSADPGPSGEYYLTDAFQYMVDKGARIRTAPVAGWFDCGRPEVLLATNRHLLATSRGGVSPQADTSGSQLDPLVRVEEGAVVLNSVLGANVTVEAGARIVDSTLSDTIVGMGATVEGSTLEHSLIGARALVQGFSGQLSVAADSEVNGS